MDPGHSLNSLAWHRRPSVIYLCPPPVPISGRHPASMPLALKNLPLVSQCTAPSADILTGFEDRFHASPSAELYMFCAWPGFPVPKISIRAQWMRMDWSNKRPNPSGKHFRDTCQEPSHGPTSASAIPLLEQFLKEIIRKQKGKNPSGTQMFIAVLLMVLKNGQVLIVQ